ncbi:MAG: hypothetical protein WDN75_19810 [Bacteroidota bacterium]
MLYCRSITSYAQTTFKEDVKAFIEYDSPLIAFTNALLIDGKGNAPRANQTVIIRNGKIESIGDAKITIPKEATVIDLKGKALLPGLVMLHEHMYYPAISIKPYYAHYKQLPVTFPPMYPRGRRHHPADRRKP